MNSLTYSTDPRPDSRLTTPALGLWLFLASEIMLFGSLFSSYALLRLGAEAWPDGVDRLPVGLGVLSTVVLIASCLTLFKGCRGLQEPRFARARWWLAISSALGVLFVTLQAMQIKVAVNSGWTPSVDIFSALFVTLLGVHSVHAVGGLLVLAYLVGPGFPKRVKADSGKREVESKQFAQRVELTTIFWHFLALVWLVILLLLYL